MRIFPVYGTVCWGCLMGVDQLTSGGKYIPIRRLAYSSRKPLPRTQWVAPEPNDEPLWAQILNVGAFTNLSPGCFPGISTSLFRQMRRETTQSDIDNGIVNIEVGFAPLKPAEFVILKLQQMAGQIQV
jgi:phage tail sheath protein FI